MRLPPGELRSLQIVAAGLILAPALFLGVALYARNLGPIASVETVTYLAAAYALSSPFIASLLRQRMLAETSAGEPPPDAVRRVVIVSFGILESAAFLCGIALLLGTTYWPLAAAAVPLATMAAWFPRAEAR